MTTTTKPDCDSCQGRRWVPVTRWLRHDLIHQWIEPCLACSATST